MANSIICIKCKYCGEMIVLARGDYGCYRFAHREWPEITEDDFVDFFKKHGGYCSKSCGYVELKDNFELVDYYD